jgi:hypothetical protein
VTSAKVKARPMTAHLYAELARLRNGMEISRSSAMALARFGYARMREARVYERGAIRKVVQRTITKAGLEALERREKELRSPFTEAVLVDDDGRKIGTLVDDRIEDKSSTLKITPLRSKP